MLHATPKNAYAAANNFSLITLNNGDYAYGLLLETTYLNTGPDTLYFGITTEDEMMAAFIQFVDTTYQIPASAPWTPNCTETYIDPCLKDTTGLMDYTINDNKVALTTYPNPSNGMATITYTLSGAPSNVNLGVVSLLGTTIYPIVNNENQIAGTYSYTISDKQLAAGIYIITLQVDGNVYTQKLVISGN